MKLKSFVFILLSTVLLVAQGYNNRVSEFTGRCSKVYSHQTISIMQGFSALRVRLYDIGDARKPAGATLSAAAYLSSLVLNDSVYVRVTANQEAVGSGGVTGIVFLNGVNINEKMINDGYALRRGEVETAPAEPTFGLEPRPIGPDSFEPRTIGPDSFKR